MIGFVALFAPVGFFALHCAALRVPSLARRAPQELAALVAVFGFFLEGSYLVVSCGGSPEAFLFAGICSAGAAHAYFHFFNMSETARRIRIVVCRYLKKPLPPEGDWAESTERRLQRLRSIGEARGIGPRWSTTKGPLTRLATVLVAYERWLFPERR